MSKGLVALKRLFIKIKHYDSLDEKVMLENDYSTIEKELKAFDIIVSKVQLGGFIDSLKQTKNYEEYKNTYITLLTEEEYELLKEVLKND